MRPLDEVTEGIWLYPTPLGIVGIIFSLIQIDYIWAVCMLIRYFWSVCNGHSIGLPDSITVFKGGIPP